MRIAQMYRNLGTGGIEAMICGLSNEISKNHDVTVCTIVAPSPDDKFYKELAPAIHRKSIGRTGKSKPFLEMVKIARFVKNGNFDVVQIHGFFYYFALAVLLYHRKMVFCYTIHSDAYKENNPWDLRIIFFKKFFFKKGWLHPITISHVSQSSFFNLYGCDNRLIRNGVIQPVPNPDSTVNPYKISSHTKVFLHASRVCPEKNQVMLCRVFDRLIREGKDVVLAIAGPIHHHDIYDEMQKYFSNRIRYIGNRSDIPALLCSADGMCLSSNYEGLPVILLEALAAGCIPVCTAVGGIVDVIDDGIDGFLAAEVSEEAYYQTMKRYLNLSEAERGILKKNCLAKSEFYTISRCAREYLAYYENLLARNR